MPKTATSQGVAVLVFNRSL